jgi:acetylornithine deacetylase/succinyl-diaminopimelate desuccinylase-like protein
MPSHHSIPATARAIVDFYLIPGQDPADIFDKLKRHLQTRGFSDIHVTLRYAGSPTYTPAHHNFVQQVIQSAERVYGCNPILLPLLPEYVPIQSFTKNPCPPVIILPLYMLESQEQDVDGSKTLWKGSAAHLIYTMLRLGQN